MTRDDMTRLVRSMVVSVASVLMVTSVSACGATHVLLGIHQAPKQVATSAPVTVDQAKRILARVFTAAYLAQTTTSAAEGAELRTAYTSEALLGASARVKLASVQPPAATSPLLAPHPRLLAVSRGFGFPRFMVAQTVESEGALPVLHLLISPDAATPYRICLSAEMVPPATIQPFDPLTQGSPLVTDGAGLAVAPATLLNLYAAQMAFPAKPVAKPPFAADSFFDQVTAGAVAGAKAVASQATFTQVHKVVPNSVYAVGQAGGGALVFGVLQRTDSFAVKAGQRVNTTANKPFVLLTGKRLVSNAASISTLEFVVFAVPRSSGQATLVAAREQIVAGSGS
jgi:hypothetical protein